MESRHELAGARQEGVVEDGGLKSRASMGSSPSCKACRVVLVDEDTTGEDIDAGGSELDDTTLSVARLGTYGGGGCPRVQGGARHTRGRAFIGRGSLVCVGAGSTVAAAWERALSLIGRTHRSVARAQGSARQARALGCCWAEMLSVDGS